MTTKAQLIERISRYPDNDDEYAVAIWCKEDVQGKAEELGITLTDEQVKEILNNIDRKQDCELGISWLTLECYIEDYKKS